MSADARLVQARAIIKKKARVVGEMGLFDVVHRLGWFDHIHYDEEAVLQLRDFEDLQVVALAAALIAYTEGVR